MVRNKSDKDMEGHWNQGDRRWTGCFTLQKPRPASIPEKICRVCWSHFTRAPPSVLFTQPPNSTFSDITLGDWKHPCWEHLHKGIWQKLLLKSRLLNTYQYATHWGHPVFLTFSNSSNIQEHGNMKERWRKQGFWQSAGLWKPWRRQFKQRGGGQSAGVSGCQGTSSHRTNRSHLELES